MAVPPTNATMDFATWLQQQGLDPTTMSPEELASWRPQYDASQQTFTNTATPPPPPPTTPPPPGATDPGAFGRAWLASGGQTPADLAAFVKAHPEYGATVGGSKGDKVTIGSNTYDAIIGAGAGGLGASWNDITNAASDGASAGPSGPSAAQSWFTANSPAAFSESFTAPARPDYLSQPYTPPTWSEQYTAPAKPASIANGFSAPTLADLQNDPGYQAMLDAAQKGQQHSAAAKGSLLSGGTQVALGKTLEGVASQEYGNVYNRALNTFGANEGAYQFDVGNAYNSYQQRYKQFSDAAGMGLQGRQLNESAFQNDVLNQFNQYKQRYQAYQDLVKNNLGYAQLGLNATTAGAPGVPS